MRRRSQTFVLLCMILVFARVSGAQTVTGTVVSSGDRAAVPGAIVALLDSTGRAIVSELAEDDGSFRLVAPLPGRFSVRAERVGFRSSIVGPILIASGATVAVSLAFASEGVSLRAVQISADRRCVVRPQEGLAAAQLWNEARKALSATQLTQLAQAAAHARRDGHVFLIRTRKFSRDLAPTTLAPLHEEQYEIEGETLTPFASRDPELLARDGYMSGNVYTGAFYFAPDATILLSDRFLDSHCFRVAEPKRDGADLVGLAFEPARLTAARDRRVTHVEISGVLWLDRSTAELRYMEYRYVNLPVDVPDDAAGGLLEFRPLPDGRWIVWRWYIRMPQMARRETFADPLTSSRAELRLQLQKIHEEGAEVLEVVPPGARRPSLATLGGVVFDSTRGAALAGARVFLSGTTLAAVTAPDGSYSISAIPPGRYTVSVVAARLDSLLIDPPARELTLSAGREQRIDLALPAVRTLSTRWCPGVPATDSAAIVVGVVRDTSGSSAAGATVRAEWQSFSRASADRLAARAQVMETQAAAGGRFALCGLPADTRLTLKARRGGNVVASPVLHLQRGEVRRIDLRLKS